MARTRGQLSPATVRARKRQHDAFQLRIQGLQFTEIAERVGYSGPSGAHKAVKSHLKRLGPPAEAEEYRRLQLVRLEKVLTRCWLEMAKEGKLQLKVVDRVLRTIREITDLMALRIPTDDRMTVEVRGLPDLGVDMGIEEIARHAKAFDILAELSPEDQAFLRQVGWNNGPPAPADPDSDI